MSAKVEGSGYVRIAATVGVDTSMILSAISARLSRVMSVPEGARTMRTLLGKRTPARGHHWHLHHTRVGACGKVVGKASYP